MKKLNLLIPIILAITFVYCCGSSDVSDAVKVFSRYCQAMREGNLQETAYCWSLRDYPKFTKERRESFKKVKTSILKAEKKDNYIRLFVKFEEDTSSYDKWVYFIKETGRIVMAHRVKALTMDWLTVESPHFILHSKDITNEETIVGKLEDYYKKITDVVGIEAEGKIEYFLFDSEEGFSKIFGHKPRGEITMGRSIISWKFRKEFIPSHEMTHAIFYALGMAIPFLSEGIATFSYYYIFCLDWKGHSLEHWINEYMDTGRYVPISDLIAGSKFYEVPSEISYKETASFVAYLIEKGGIEKFRELYAHSSSENEFKEMVKALYGKNINQMEEEWKKLIMRLQTNNKCRGIVRGKDKTRIFLNLGRENV